MTKSITLLAIFIAFVAADVPACNKPENPCGDPLFLTPLINAGQIAQARNLSQVFLPDFKYPSYSGYLEVNASCGNQLFFWYFPAQNGDKNAPLVLWLQGGPGAPSLFGLFAEIGPITIDSQDHVVAQPYTWNSKYSLLFIDQPAGTGFSMQGNGCAVQNEKQVGQQLVNFFLQFYQIFPELLSVEYYTAGESYGGKYAPATTNAIDSYNRNGFKAEIVEGMQWLKAAPTRLPLTGMILADPWSDPQSQMPEYANFYYQSGIMDTLQSQEVVDYMNKAEQARARGDYVTAFTYWNAVTGDYTMPWPSLFNNFTGGTNTENIRYSNDDPNISAYFFDWINEAEPRRAMHVGSTDFGVIDIYNQLVQSGDFMDTIKPLMPNILNNYRVMIYNGNVDSICGVSGTEAFIRSIQWNGSSAYNSTMRKVWKVDSQDSEVAGYVAQVNGGNFTRVVVRNAGHILPADQPRAAFDMADRFISRRGFY